MQSYLVQRKKNRFVHEWLQQVQATEREFQTLSNELQRKGFVRQFFVGGEAAKLNARVRELIEQGKYFGEPVHDDYNVKGEKFLTKEIYLGREKLSGYRWRYSLLAAVLTVLVNVRVLIRPYGLFEICFDLLKIMELITWVQAGRAHGVLG